MKLILISDIHLLSKKPVARLDNAIQTCFEKLSFVMAKAKELNCGVLVAGDFFDQPRDWYVWQNLTDIIRGVKIYSVFGQHDTYKYSEKTRHSTNLGVLSTLSDDVIILGPEPYAELGVRIYGCHIGQPVSEVEDHEFKNLLVIHAPISLEDHPYVEHNAEDFLTKHKDYDLILCGDIHKKFIFEKANRIICNTGPMIRKTVDDFNHEPCFFVYDSAKHCITEHKIPYLPPEEVLSREHIEASEKREALLKEFITQVSANKGVQSSNLFKNIERFIKVNKVPQSVQNILSEVMQDE